MTRRKIVRPAKKPRVIVPIDSPDEIDPGPFMDLPDTTGYIDSHCHLDRALTYADRYFRSEGGLQGVVGIDLKQKQSAVGKLHRGLAFKHDSLYKRMKFVIEAKHAAGERVLHAIVDCTTDIDDRAFKIALELREEFKDKIDVRVGNYALFGFVERNSDRHKLFRRLAPLAQFLVLLPERDADPTHSIGFNGHLRIGLETAMEFNKPVHAHVDQINVPWEDGTERLVEATRWLVHNSGVPENARPTVSAVHVISPARYSNGRKKRLIYGLKECGIEVIVCPDAALSMRQLSTYHAPIGNSIADVMLFVANEIPVRIGTDNIMDLFMPRPHRLLVKDQLDSLATDVREYGENILQKIARWEPMLDLDIQTARNHILSDKAACERAEEMRLAWEKQHEIFI